MKHCIKEVESNMYGIPTPKAHLLAVCILGWKALCVFVAVVIVLSVAVVFVISQLLHYFK
jgi:hypothetical protein